MTGHGAPHWRSRLDGAGTVDTGTVMLILDELEGQPNRRRRHEAPPPGGRRGVDEPAYLVAAMAGCLGLLLVLLLFTSKDKKK